MLRRELLLALAERQRLGGLNEAAGAVRVFLEIHVFSLSLSVRPFRRGSNIFNGSP
jgi:hypothetical protein